MPTPPATPPSSDIGGVNRDGGKIVAEGKKTKPRPQEQLREAADQTVARPDYDPDIAAQGNAQ